MIKFLIEIDDGSGSYWSGSFCAPSWLKAHAILLGHSKWTLLGEAV